MIDGIILSREWFLNTFKRSMEEAIKRHGPEYAAVAWTAYLLFEDQFQYGTDYVCRERVEEDTNPPD